MRPNEASHLRGNKLFDPSNPPPPLKENHVLSCFFQLSDSFRSIEGILSRTGQMGEREVSMPDFHFFLRATKLPVEADNMHISISGSRG